MVIHRRWGVYVLRCVDPTSPTPPRCINDGGQPRATGLCGDPRRSIESGQRRSGIRLLVWSSFEKKASRLLALAMSVPFEFGN